jgi:hypothetical protein
MSKSSDQRPPTPIALPLPAGVKVEQRPSGPAGGERPVHSYDRGGK